MTQRLLLASVIGLLLPGAPVAGDALPELATTPIARPDVPNAPPLPSPAQFPVQLVLDDDTAEAATGVLGPGGAKQFLWFNRFASPGTFHLEQIWVLFPTGAQMSVGASVQLVVYHDPDGDPTNGADLLATFDETIQVLDDVTFSVYDLAPAVDVPAGGDVLIGVVDRFVTSGVTPLTLPAAIDTTASQQRSWIATWIADPPAPPALPSDGAMVLLDDLLPTVAGNWMIRGFGTGASAVEIPTLDGIGLALLVLLLAGASAVLLRRTRTASR